MAPATPTEMPTICAFPNDTAVGTGVSVVCGVAVSTGIVEVAEVGGAEDVDDLVAVVIAGVVDVSVLAVLELVAWVELVIADVAILTLPPPTTNAADRGVGCVFGSALVSPEHI
ncbi:hypothetical protein SCAR479_00773 [Seiridium cardinale]|uniref:Uncharacterized protein n=1 Tax=Seiridium cardinale TaxID=138064 RepID=A0ABR2Y6S9_9PEZI